MRGCIPINVHDKGCGRVLAITRGWRPAAHGVSPATQSGYAWLHSDQRA
jgi:hypothetical protein